ncbi:aldose 1-epimerase family protein [Flavobacterium sp. '19STA2R22 D10 B1']|uniref:aldose 1-epimerase family protein n=1 Tax=Flavobacterium aerium TaxID=3037261 RepID=UPI00278BE509|nr:aldose 1-epimerase family protein [Flavobacterium sp. '19STA2R22 D10 B1']
MNTTISNEFLSVTINDLGAELISIKDTNNKEYMWNADPKFWNKNSPILFPIIGSIKNDTYIYNDNQYHLDRHGFARDSIFKIIKTSENSICFSLSNSATTLVLYPFAFELRITYTLIEKSIEVSYHVKNKSENRMPFSIGAHPAFALPNAFTDYAIEFEKEEPLISHILKDGLLTHETEGIATIDRKLPLSYSLLKNDTLIFKDLKSKQVTLLDHSTPLLRVHFDGFTTLGIWTQINAPYICIEPWYGHADRHTATGDLFDKEGIIALDPKEDFKTSYTIELC